MIFHESSRIFKAPRHDGNRISHDVFHQEGTFSREAFDVPIPRREVHAVLEVMKELMKSKDTCVLATVSGNEPHCSLMSYAVDEDCREIYMMTLRNTRKYENLMANPAVSLLVDTRGQDSPENRPRTKALTVTGRFERIESEEEQERIRNRLLERHPHLKAFAESPETEFFRIRAKSFQLLDGITDASFVSLD